MHLSNTKLSIYTKIRTQMHAQTRVPIRHFYAHINTNFAIFKIYKFWCPITNLTENLMFHTFTSCKMQTHTWIFWIERYTKKTKTPSNFCPNLTYIITIIVMSFTGYGGKLLLITTSYSILHPPSSIPYIIQMKTKRTPYFSPICI